MVASFLPLWFGMVVGDIGYGILFAVLSWYLSGYIRKNQPLALDLFKMRLSPRTIDQMVKAMKPMMMSQVTRRLRAISSYIIRTAPSPARAIAAPPRSTGDP